jgi:hypothetical protein
MKKRRSANLKAVEAMGLPTPRMQFRWEPIAKPADGFNWFCHYELVLHLRMNDIRNPHEFKKDGELTVELGGTRMSGDSPMMRDGTVDVPFRDGAHSCWDGAQIGNPPVFAIFGDKVTNVTELRLSNKAA